MEELRWEKFKKHDDLDLLSCDEVAMLAIGVTIFGWFQKYGVLFILLIVIWYWLKIKYLERKIVQKEREIYNRLYENINPGISQGLLEKKTENDREPMRYDLRQLENRRKFLVDKFVILNLILVILIQLFIAE